MSVANDKVSKEATGLVVEFLIPDKGKANGPNNYLAWAGAMHTTMGARYGQWPGSSPIKCRTSCPISKPTMCPKRITRAWKVFLLPTSMPFEDRR